MNTLIDEIPAQTIENVRDLLNLLRVTDLEDMAERPAMGVHLALTLADDALTHLVDNYQLVKKEATQ